MNTVFDRIAKRTSSKDRKRFKERFNRPFSSFGRILPDEWVNWDVNNWEKDEYIQLASGEAWNLDENTEEGYLAMKRMLYDLVNPQNEDLDLDEFTLRLKELYELRKNN